MSITLFSPIICIDNNNRSKRARLTNYLRHVSESMMNTKLARPNQ